MKWGRNLKLSIIVLWRVRLRTLLSVSGVAIGIASVSVMLGVGAGAERELQATLEEMGRNLLVINAVRTQPDALRGESRLVETLSEYDAEAIAANIPGLDNVAPIVDGGGLLRVGDLTLPVTVTGSTPAIQLTKNFPLVAGRFITNDDVEAHTRVAVIGAQVATDLYGMEYPVDETLLVNGAPYRVVGVMQRKGVSPDGANEDAQIIIPLSTAMRRFVSVDYLNRIYVQVSERELMPAAQNAIGRLLIERHGLDALSPPDFEISDQAAIVEAQTETKQSFTDLIAGLAALTLLLGGIGLLAVLLLSVRERFGEIGLRLAVGARRRDILVQFLSEAILIAALGGVMGFVIGAFGILTGAQLTEWAIALTWKSIVYPFVVALGIAVIFGVYPALRAARLDPIVALRS